jgi:hypothetical protein
MCNNRPGVFLEEHGKQDGRKRFVSSAGSDNLDETVQAGRTQKKSKACPRADTTSAGVTYTGQRGECYGEI